MKTIHLKNSLACLNKRSCEKFFLLTVLLGGLLFSEFSFAVPICEADPTDEGDISVSGTPGSIIYYQSNGNATAGTKTIPVTTTTGLAVDDMIIVIQMQGADINATNSNSYGSGVAAIPASGFLNNANFVAGRYEYATVASVTATQITVKSNLTNSYFRANFGAQGQRRFQVIRVPQYNNLTFIGNVTAPAWNGETGGVLPLDVTNTLNFNGYTIDVSAKGFRAGRGFVHSGIAGYLNTDYRNNATNTASGAQASKGEGLAGTPRYVWNGTSISDTGFEGYPNGSYAMGAPGNAGGGGTDGHPSGNDENSGGGGGGNGGPGARGGNSWNSNLAVGGFGGAAFSGAANRVVMGGGGGAATGNNATTLAPHGGVGGGIVLIRADVIQGTGTINANGSNGTTPIVANDGGGGGGAGGSVILLANSQVGSITVNARGGGGGNADPGGAAHGPGGGGGGGAVFNNPEISPTVSVSQGASGYTVTAGNYYGSPPTGGGVGNGVSNTDPNTVDGTGAGANCITRSDLSIVKTRSSGLMQASGTVQFQNVVSNAGADATSVNIIVTDVLDSVFTYTGFTGTGWACVEVPAQTITCTHAGPLAASASLPNLVINANISGVASGAVSNTATVALQTNTVNKDINAANNSSTVNDTIYAPTSGNKNLYLYPTSATAGTVQRVVPSTNQTQTIERGNGAGKYMELTLSPAVAANLTFSNNILLHLCLQRQGNNSTRTFEARLFRGATQVGNLASFTTSSGTWQWHTFTMTPISPPITITPAQSLILRITNAGGDTNNRDVGITNNVSGSCGGSAAGASSSISHIVLDASTVINVGSVQVYNAASPSGVLVTNTVENATVYVRATISDPFGFADINNDTTLSVLDNTNSSVLGPINDTAILSASGASKEFEYAVTMPNDRLNGPFTMQVRGNEGTEATVTHYGASVFTLTEQPLLVVSKLSSKSGPGASPGEDIDYRVVVSNTSILGTGDAATVIVTDVLPKFTAFKVGSIAYTNPYAPYINSGLSVASIEYFNGVTWAYVPTGTYDANVQQFRVTFSGIMPPNGGFSLNYIVRLN